MDNQETDICLVLEGTYPYVSGGVSSWVHDLILSQPHLKFSLVCIMPPEGKKELKYDLPGNVASIDHITLQSMKKRDRKVPKAWRKELFRNLEMPILRMQHHARLQDLETIIKGLHKGEYLPDESVLLNSKEAWVMLLRMYRSSIGEGSYLNFFWSWRGLLAGMYSVLIADIPPAKVYHSLCTGYAGLYLARTYLQTGKPCILTEHGIYTNERRIEITAADWLNDQKAMNLNIARPHYERDLKDYWIDTFSGYSKLCYEASKYVITLYEGNLKFQLEDGVDPEKIKIIPNGVDVERYAGIQKGAEHPPTVALIGRVVSIKDVKTYIRAVAKLREKIPNLQALVIGPTDEEEEYFQECLEMVKSLELDETLTFTGKVKIDDYLNQIDLLVLTSISEAQPLVILEAGSSGIPFVATDVGSCREIAYGRSDEDPNFGQGGDICPLSNPTAVADSMYRFLSDKLFYQSCSQALLQRIKAFYHKKDQKKAYDMIYKECLKKDKAWQV